jgi:hypothetical protein
MDLALEKHRQRNDSRMIDFWDQFVVHKDVMHPVCFRLITFAGGFLTVNFLVKRSLPFVCPSLCHGRLSTSSFLLKIRNEDSATVGCGG